MKIPQIVLNCINPQFLQKADKYLLLNYPRIWVTKIHYVFYYGLLANIILNTLVYLLIKPHQIDEFINFIIVLVMLVELVSFIYWFSQQCLFNLEQEYGNTNHINDFLEIIIYTICTLIIVSFSFTMTWTAMDKIAKTSPIIDGKTDCFNESVWISKFCLSGDESCYADSDSFCDDIQSFIKNDKHYFTDTLHYSVHWGFHAILSILGILILMIRKHSNWRTLSLSGLYLLILIIISLLFGTFLIYYQIDFFAFLNKVFFYFDISRYQLGDKTIIGIILLILFLSIITSIQLIQKRTYDQFSYINFVIIPILILVLTFYLGSNLQSFNSPDVQTKTMQEISLLFIEFFLVYLCFVPLQKWILTRTQSLPKK